MSGNDVFLAAEIAAIWLLVLALGLVVFVGLDIWLDMAISKKIKKLLGVED